jgi:hypothetical protein
MPLVRFSEQVRKAGAWGLYGGGTTVWLSDDLAPLDSIRSQAYNTLVHEMVHYLQYWEDRSPMSSGLSCMAEEEAFEVSGKLAQELQMPEMDRRGKWQEYYFGC